MTTTSSSSSSSSYRPDYAIAPGESLRETLATLGMSQSNLATRAGLSLKHVNQIVQGLAPITHETALALEKVTGVRARLWNSLESNYRDRLARMQDREVLASDSQWLRSLPITELRRRGYISEKKETGSVLQEACAFFGVANKDAWEKVWGKPLASFRKSKAFASDTAALAAWLRIGEIEAAEIKCEPFDARNFRDALRSVRELTTAPVKEWVANIVRICAKAGVAVVFVPEIKGARASGAARWLNSTKALIQLSLRHKSDDHLWFSFFHEAGHLLLHGKKQTFITNDRLRDVAEDEADEFSRTYLIPKSCEQELSTLDNDRSIRSFAERVGIAPGIVVGRLQNEGFLNWNQHNNLKQRPRRSKPEAAAPGGRGSVCVRTRLPPRHNPQTTRWPPPT
jgi:HTH-type transcriptional regulator / antitoxin HigA